MAIVVSKSKKTGIMLIVFAIILAFIVAGLSYYTISSVTKKAPVLVVKQDVEIQKGDPIDKNKFDIQMVPKGSIIKGTMNPSADLAGYVAAVPLMPGEVLKSSQIIKLSENENDIPLLSARLKAMNDPSLVAGEIPIDSVKGMMAGMKASDKISVVNVYRNDKKEVVSETVIPYADVLGIRSGDDGSALIIAITHDQSKILAAAREKGTIYAYLLPYGVKEEEVAKYVGAGTYKTTDGSAPIAEGTAPSAENTGN